jgi:glycosyltransferase involved in cell wall biosynthesis
MSKRVILFGPMPPPYGGVSVLLSTLWGHVKSAPVLVWAYFGQESNDPRITRFNHRRFGVIKALVKQGYRSRIVDFTHFHLEYPHPILLPIWLVAKRLLGFEWVKHICDGSLPERYPGFTPAQKRRFKKAIAAIDEFILVNETLRDWLTSEVTITRKMTVIPSLLNIPPEAQEMNLDAGTERILENFLKREKRICSIGTFIPAYGFEHVAITVERLRTETQEDIGVLLLDGTFATDPSYRERVLAGRDWITVLTNIPNPEIYQILSRSDLFVRAFGAESYGISRVEAIWSGVPVIAVNVGETRGMLTYTFGDVEMLSRLIREVLSGERKVELEPWADLFRAEADANLNNFIETARIDCPTIDTTNRTMSQMRSVTSHNAGWVDLENLD